MNGVVASLFALLAVATAGVVVPSFYNAYTTPYAYNAYSPYHYGAPLAYSAYSTYSAPLAYSTAHVAPIAYTAPAIQSGYVAANRGAVHIAPLPEGPHAASHHINTAPAPGTL